MNWEYNPEHNSLDTNLVVPWSTKPMWLMVEQESVPDEDEPAYMTAGQRETVNHLHTHIDVIRELILKAVAEKVEELERSEAAHLRRNKAERATIDRALGLLDEEDEDTPEEPPDWWGEDEDDEDEDEDSVRTADLFSLDRVKVHIDIRQGLASLTFEGHCAWDGQHGLAVHYLPGDDHVTLDRCPRED